MLCITARVLAICFEIASDRISGAKSGCILGSQKHAYIVTFSPRFKTTSREYLDQANAKIIIAQYLEIVNFGLAIQENVRA